MRSFPALFPGVLVVLSLHGGPSTRGVSGLNLREPPAAPNEGPATFLQVFRKTESERSPAEFEEEEEVEESRTPSFPVGAPLPAAAAASKSLSSPPALAQFSANPLPQDVPVLRQERQQQHPPNASSAQVFSVAASAKPVVPLDYGGASEYEKCNPPCLDGRGVCNDNTCFCRYPYTGPSCQHQITNLYRFSFAILVAFSAFCLFLGVMLANWTFAWTEDRSAKHLEKFCERHATGKQTEEWAPPEEQRGPAKKAKKKKKPPMPPKKVAREDDEV